MDERPVPLAVFQCPQHIAAMRYLSRQVRQTVWFFRASWPPLFLLTCSAALAVWAPVAWLAWLAVCGAVLLGFDSLARHRDFKRLRGLIRVQGGLEGPARCAFRQARASWCTRTAALAAARAEGAGGDAAALIEKWGYRPWHIFPDRAFTRQSPFLKYGFWKSVLGLARS